MTFSALRASLAALALLAAPTLAFAKSYTIPDPNPVAVITMPDDWETTVIAKGIESESDDEEVYVAVEVAELKDAKEALAGAVAYLLEKKVKIDESSMQQVPFSNNGLEGIEVRWNGTDEDGPTQVSVTLVKVSDTKGLVLTYWSSPEGEKDNLKDLQSIIGSLKPVK